MTFKLEGRTRPRVVSDARPRQAEPSDRGNARGLYVETQASKSKENPPPLIPAWMFTLAWDYLQAHRGLTFRYFLATDASDRSASSWILPMTRPVLASIIRVQVHLAGIRVCELPELAPRVLDRQSSHVVSPWQWEAQLDERERARETAVTMPQVLPAKWANPARHASAELPPRFASVTGAGASRTAGRPRWSRRRLR